MRFKLFGDISKDWVEVFQRDKAINRVVFQLQTDGFLCLSFKPFILRHISKDTLVYRGAGMFHWTQGWDTHVCGLFLIYRGCQIIIYSLQSYITIIQLVCLPHPLSGQLVTGMKLFLMLKICLTCFKSVLCSQEMDRVRHPFPLNANATHLSFCESLMCTVIWIFAGLHIFLIIIKGVTQWTLLTAWYVNTHKVSPESVLPGLDRWHLLLVFQRFVWRYMEGLGSKRQPSN